MPVILAGLIEALPSLMGVAVTGTVLYYGSQVAKDTTNTIHTGAEQTQQVVTTMGDTLNTMLPVLMIGGAVLAAYAVLKD